MSTELNRRKKEILDQQELMLMKAHTSKIPLTATENARFENFTKELDEINNKLNPDGKTLSITSRTAAKFTAFGSNKPLIVDNAYVSDFYRALKSQNAMNAFQIRNAALGEGGTASDGSYLTPVSTDMEIPAQAMVECSMRSLARVIETQANIYLPYQSAKSTAAIKAESNNSGTNAFGTSVPNFASVLLSAFVLGNNVQISWELLEDSKLASQFITAELQRAIRTQEEYLFINGSGTAEPQGILGNVTTATGTGITAGAATLSIGPLLQQIACLNRAYYASSSWLVNRSEFLRLVAQQLAADIFQVYVQWGPNGSATLCGWPVQFSYEMPQYVASPATEGAWLFGSFKDAYTIGDRGSSAIRLTILDQTSALDGATNILGFRRSDGRVLLQEAVIQLNTNG